MFKTFLDDKYQIIQIGLNQIKFFDTHIINIFQGISVYKFLMGVNHMDKNYDNEIYKWNMSQNGF